MGSMLLDPSSSYDHSSTTPVDRGSTQYDGWMNTFCDEPSGDVLTCCAGFWVPCLLFGKIEERINIVQKGKSLSEAGNGCNADCLVWQVSLCGFGGALTANRRTRVRGLYAIKGSLKDDCIKSVFCNRCVLIQIDREIRARDGKTSLCTSSDYARRCSKAINLQPAPVRPMTYTPGEGAEVREVVENMVLFRRPSQARLPAGFKKSAVAHHQLQEVLNDSGIDHAIEAVVKCAKSELTPRQVDVQKSKVEIDPKLKPEASAQIIQPINRANLLPQASASTSDANSKPSPTTKRKGLRSFFNAIPDIGGIFKSNPSQRESAVSVNDKAQLSSNTTEPSSQSNKYHADEVSQAPSGPSTVKIHTLGECESESCTDLSPDTPISEHSLTDCETIAVVGQRSSNASVNQLSYAHDFTDCPVDGGILEYFEQQERRSKVHNLVNCSILAPTPISNSNAKPLSTENKSKELPDHCRDSTAKAKNIPDHGLMAYELAKSMDSDISQIIQQHVLDNCERTKSIASIVVDTIESNNLTTFPDCWVEKLVRSREIQQHTLTDCTRFSLVAPSLVERKEPETSPTSPGADKIETMQELSDCCELGLEITAVKQAGQTQEPSQAKVLEEIIDCCGLDPELTVIKQHDLSQCSRSSSMSALYVQKNSTHRLSQCTRSSSFPMLEVKDPFQHALEDCSRANSITGPRDESYSVYKSLALEDGHTEQSSEESHRSQETIQASRHNISKRKQAITGQNEEVFPKENKIGKGKQRAARRSEQRAPEKQTTDKGKGRLTEEHICNIPGLADRGPQIERAESITQVKNPDVIVAVDVVVGGQKVKAQATPILDDRKSIKHRQIRQDSAQQALEYVLASSSRDKLTAHNNSRKYPYQRYPRRNKNWQQKEDSQKGESTVVVLGLPGPESIAAQEVEKPEKQEQMEVAQSASQRFLAAVSGLVGGNGGKE